MKKFFVLLVAAVVVSFPVFADDASKTAGETPVSVSTGNGSATPTDRQLSVINKKIKTIDKDKKLINKKEEKLQNSKEKQEVSGVKTGFDEVKLTVSEKITWAQIKKTREDRRYQQELLKKAKTADEKGSINAEIRKLRAKDAWLVAKIKSVDAKMLEDKDDIMENKAETGRINKEEKGLNSGKRDLNDSKDILEDKKGN
jgi:hypothetical protein